MLTNETLLGKFLDEDGTKKFVYKTKNGIVEITNIKNKKGSNIDVLCIPSHHFCNLGCKFCHLTEGEGSEQPMNMIESEVLGSILETLTPKLSSNILLSFMGVGEPFLNATLIPSIYEMLKEKCKNISLALATMMPTIKPMDYFITQVLKNNLPLKITFSLHSSIDEIRNNIIPSSKVTIKSCLEALVRYRDIVIENKFVLENLEQFHSSITPILLHYTVIEGVNDTQEELERLIDYGRRYEIPLKILKFNPTKFLTRSSKEKYWFDVLSLKYKANVVFYEPPGLNIGSSCGQFTKHYYLKVNSKEEQEEFEKWKLKYQVFD